MTYGKIRDWIMVGLKDMGDDVSNAQVYAAMAEQINELYLLLSAHTELNLKTAEITYNYSTAAGPLPADCGLLLRLSRTNDDGNEEFIDITQAINIRQRIHYNRISTLHGWVLGSDVKLSRTFTANQTLTAYYIPKVTADAMTSTTAFEAAEGDARITMARALKWGVLAELAALHAVNEIHLYRQKIFEARYQEQIRLISGERAAKPFEFRGVDY